MPANERAGGQRCGAHQRQRPNQPGQAGDVACAGFVVQDAGHHEQSPLIQPMPKQKDERGFHGTIAAQSQQAHHQAERADGGIGQQPLQVGLA
jgi:hypothetical protein